MSEARPVFGSTPRKFGKVLASVHYESKAQARLLQRVLEKGMRDFAGKPEETFLAKSYNEIENTVARAEREGWTGWTQDSGGT